MPSFSGSVINHRKNNTLNFQKNLENKSLPCDKNDETTFYAVIAACSRYNDSRNNIPKKPFSPVPDHKLRALYTSLLKYDNWNEENIILLLNEDATRDNIVNALKNMSNRVTEKDVFLFQWQGHGTSVLDANGDETDGFDELICPFDYDKNNSVYLTDDMLNENFSKIHSKGQIIIIESCLSGGLADGANDIDQKDRVVILATLPHTLGRGTYLFGFAINFGLSITLNKESNFLAEDHNNDGFLSIEETFHTSKFITFAANGFYWASYWFLILHNLKDFSESIKALLFAFVYLEFLSLILTRHFMLNVPHMIDNYQEELPLVQCN